MTIKSNVEAIEFSYEDIQDALVQWLRNNGELGEGEVVLATDIPIELDDEGFVTIDFEIGGDYAEDA